jgi:hypothetical protein
MTDACDHTNNSTCVDGVNSGVNRAAPRRRRVGAVGNCDAAVLHSVLRKQLLFILMGLWCVDGLVACALLLWLLFILMGMCWWSGAVAVTVAHLDVVVVC